MNPLGYQPPGTIIMRCEVGSRLHGVSVDDGVDDHDEVGIVAEHPEYVTGLRRWDTKVLRTAKEGERSKAGDLDLTYHSLRKYVGLACQGNPSLLALLYAPEDKIYHDTALGQGLRGLADQMVSMKTLPRFRGYMRAQALRLLGEQGRKRGQRTGARPELVEAHGWDVKFGYHMVRLGLQGRELARTGRLELPMPESDRELCLSIREGEHSVDTVLNLAFELDAQLADYMNRDRTVLRSEPNYKVVNAWLHWAYSEAWNKAL